VLFARQPFPARIPFLHQHRQQGIVAQLLVVVQVFISQSQSVHPLGHQFFQPVLDSFPSAMIAETSRELTDHPHPLLHFPQQQTTPVTADRSALELRPHLTAI